MFKFRRFYGFYKADKSKIIIKFEEIKKTGYGEGKSKKFNSSNKI